MSKTVSVKQIADSWGLSTRRVNQLCHEGKIQGAFKEGKTWRIPQDVVMADFLQNKHKKTTELLPCPVGITSYKEVSSECYYVDKTLLIKDIIDDHNKVTLFTRPRRFGKTLTMDMLKTFFEKTDEDTSKYFIHKNIWSCSNSYKTYQGAYPVIFLSFKDAHQDTWENMYESLSISIRNEYKRHINILSSDQITNIDKAFYERVLNGELSRVECELSLSTLSHILANVYKTRVVVIIDEYDTPIQQGYANGYYDEVISFMRNLFSSVLKDNSALEFGILTGILRIAKESLFSGLNNLVVNTILDEKYSEYFGFTTSEVEKMAKYYNHKNKIKEMKDWYDGYLFGKLEIYNPWSIINYFNNDCTPKAFWSRTSSNDMILDIIQNSNEELKESLTRLLQQNPVHAVVNADIIYPEIRTSEDAIYSFLLMTGYLKIEKVINTLDDNPICNLLIPNKEIKQVFKKEILDHLSKNMNQSIIRNFQLALKTNNTDALQNVLREYLLASVSSFDTAHEDFYHGMMLGLLAIMSDDYLITSNRESGNGRFDVELQPLSLTFPGIIMEFKACKEDTEESLLAHAEEALKQIQDKQYTVNLISNGITNIQLYGIAFSKKKATIKMLSLQK